MGPYTHKLSAREQTLARAWAVAHGCADLGVAEVAKALIDLAAADAFARIERQLKRDQGTRYMQARRGRAPEGGG